MKIENTTAAVLSSGNPLYGLPGVIEASERQGQVQLVTSELLPSRVHNRDTFIAMGFTFGEPLKDDQLFAPATLPAGWRKEASDHAMWSYIKDEKGRTRAAVFYKAAFYDREAHMSLRDRYQFNPKYDKDYTSVYTVVKDGEVEIHRTKTFTGDRSAVFDEADRQRETAAKWMTKNRPTWKDPIKQWD